MPEGVGYSGSNVVAGTGLELNYVGEHCYAYSGMLAVSGSVQTHLNFTTGKNLILGKLYCNGAVDMSDVARGQETAFQIKVNGVIIAQLKTSSETDDNNPTIWNDLLFPPFTNVQVTCISDAANFGETCVTFTGKVYK
jgi:hypothetical protein